MQLLQQMLIHFQINIANKMRINFGEVEPRSQIVHNFSVVFFRQSFDQVKVHDSGLPNFGRLVFSFQFCQISVFLFDAGDFLREF